MGIPTTTYAARRVPSVVAYYNINYAIHNDCTLYDDLLLGEQAILRETLYNIIIYITINGFFRPPRSNRMRVPRTD